MCVCVCVCVRVDCIPHRKIRPLKSECPMYDTKLNQVLEFWAIWS